MNVIINSVRGNV